MRSLEGLPILIHTHVSFCGGLVSLGDSNVVTLALFMLTIGVFCP